MNENFDLSNLECVGVKRQKHYLTKPVLLQCGHYMCDECIIKDTDKTNKVECRICNQRKVPNFKKNQATIMVDAVIEMHLQKLFDSIHQRCYSNLLKLKIDLDKKKEAIEVDYLFIKDAIEIRAESLKKKIDELCSKIYKDLDVQRNKVLGKIEPFYTNILNCEKELEKSNKIKENYEMKRTLGTVQEKLDYLHKLNQDLNDFDGKTYISGEQRWVDMEVLGSLTYTNNKGQGSLTIPPIFDNTIDINMCAMHFCTLPNNKLLVSDYSTAELRVYNTDMQIIKTFSETDEKGFRPYAVASNGIDRIYIFDAKTEEKKIIMTDFDFNVLKIETVSFEISDSSGLCFANNLLYLCDFDGFSIEILKPDLKFEASVDIDIKPLSIQVIDNIACVRNHLFYDEPCISFYTLPDFTLKYRYYGHNGTICIANSNFCEFYQPTSKIYCYNSDGTICKSREIEVPDDAKMDDTSSVTYFNDKIILSSYGSMSLIMP